MKDQAGNERADDGDRLAPGRVGRVLGLVSNIILLILVTAIVAVAGGFFLFLNSVAGITPPVSPRADAIVVLTGGYQRIEQGLELLAAGSGKRLLISGVNRSTSIDQIRRFTKAPPTLFDCCVDIGYEALDTAGNAEETVRWIKARGYGHVIVVTNNYHMPRSLIELRRIDGSTDYIAFPVEGTFRMGELVDHPYVVLTLASEYAKTLLTLARDYLPIGR